VINALSVILFVIGLLSIFYLLYRYMRYMPWRENGISKAFVQMKSAVLAIYLYALIRVLWPDWDGRAIALVLLIGYADMAILRQLKVVIGYQGGFSRRNPIEDDITGPGYEPRPPRVSR